MPQRSDALVNTLALGIAVVLAILPLGSAGGQCAPPTPELELAGHYVNIDPCQPDCVFSFWLYEESNGLPGLQRLDPGYYYPDCVPVADAINIGIYKDTP